MDKFLERWNLPRFNQEEIENINRLTSSTDIETVILKFPTNKNSGLDGFTGEFYQTFREELTPVLKLVQKNVAEGILPTSFYEVTITLISKSDKDIVKKEYYRPVSLINLDAKFLSKILANWIQ